MKEDGGNQRIKDRNEIRKEELNYEWKNIGIIRKIKRG
jgi:hypothetical protein